MSSILQFHTLQATCISLHKDIWGLFYQGSYQNNIPLGAAISNYIHLKLWYAITHPCPNINHQLQYSENYLKIPIHTLFTGDLHW